MITGFSLSAQTETIETSENKPRYFNNFLAGALLGEEGKGTGVSLSTTHGVRLKRWTLGAGVGFDSYLNWKAVPVFGSIGFDFANIKRNAVFLQFNAGYSNARIVNRNNQQWVSDYRDYGSEMISSLIGYRIAAEKFSLYIMAGHKFQRAHYSYNPEPWRSSYPATKISVEENMNRLVVQIGFGLH
ncbi:hypothetical protein [Chryseolinea sp. H1M3-3]|uniref:hypothetical protein n=1 Tax=Chryseolinea sp. H1M3-3 TaxID=3034144 RepID=UPI0023EE256C|nr:hypothetical protein [Chryseolinea sp. H1M3-3]